MVVSLLDVVVCLAKTVDAVVMVFGLMGQLDLRNDVLDGIRSCMGRGNLGGDILSIVEYRHYVA